MMPPNQSSLCFEVQRHLIGHRGIPRVTRRKYTLENDEVDCYSPAILSIAQHRKMPAGERHSQ